MPFTKIVPNLVVKDVERSAAFYRDVLGFEMDQKVPDAPPAPSVRRPQRRHLPCQVELTLHFTPGAGKRRR